MTKRIIVLIVLGCVTLPSSAQSNNAVQLAQKMAKRMKDSLGLSAQTKNALYDINIGLHNQKMAARTKYAGTDSVRYYMQKIENTRDQSYKPLLDSATFADYKRRKYNILNNN